MTDDYAREIDEPSAYIGYTEGQIQEMLSDSHEKLEQMGALVETDETKVGTAESEDGYIKVTYGSEGVQSIEINPRAMRYPSEDLAELIKETVNAAITNLSDQYKDVVEALGIGGELSDYADDPKLVQQRAQEAMDSFAQSMGRINDSLTRLMRDMPEPPPPKN